MLASFTLLVPIIVGAITVLLAERSARRSWRYYFLSAAGANVLFVLGTMIILIEGQICVLLAAPLFAGLGGLGGLLTGALCRWSNWPRRSIYGIAVLPLVLGAFEQRVPLPSVISTAESVRLIAAPRERVWAQLLTADRIHPDEIGQAWMYRIGVPLPLSAMAEQRGNELVRHIVMGKNIHFDQVSSDWETGRRIVWNYRFTEDSFPPHALDDHVRIGGEYFDVLDTEYALSDAPGGTYLRVRMRYRVSTNFNWYAGSIAAFLVRDFEEAALRFYSRRAEAGPPAPSSTEVALSGEHLFA
jgi:uncharacterized protein YndB with AHSA1/START domain